MKAQASMGRYWLWMAGVVSVACVAMADPPPAITAREPAPAPAVAVVTSAVLPAVTGAVVQAASPKALAAEADALLAAGKRADAREKFLSALDAAPDDALRAAVEGKLGKLNIELVRLPWPMPEKSTCTVQIGDSIRSIAQKAGTTVDLIVESNELKRPDIIKPGDRLRVFGGKLAVTVSKGRKDLLVTCNGKFFKRYLVGTGKYDKTPAGTFTVADRIKDPVWWRSDGKTIPFGDKENILGTRWLALKATGETAAVKGYGIHGTWDNDSIGKAESAGCVRLRNEDVEELFLLVPIGTPVTIEE